MTTHKTLLVLTAAALLITGCGGSKGESTPAAPAESTVNASDMSDVQAPPQRLTIDVSIAGGEVKPLNEQF